MLWDVVTKLDTKTLVGFVVVRPNIVKSKHKPCSLTLLCLLLSSLPWILLSASQARRFLVNTVLDTRHNAMF